MIYYFVGTEYKQSATCHCSFVVGILKIVVSIQDYKMCYIGHDHALPASICIG